MPAEIDPQWKADGERHGWRLPPPAPLPLRLPVLRHLRALVFACRIEREYSRGLGVLGPVRLGYDDWVLYAITRGYC
jgi:hypothetical protein